MLRDFFGLKSREPVEKPTEFDYMMACMMPACILLPEPPFVAPNPYFPLNPQEVDAVAINEVTDEANNGQVEEQVVVQ